MQHSISRKKKHAIVIGASIGGLLTARVLSNHFRYVTILEKDIVSQNPESRKGQPHTRHLHGLLPSGLNTMLHYFPGLLDDLKNRGATVLDFAESMRWYTHGGYRKSFEIGMPAVAVSRPLLEQIIRNRVLQMRGIEMKDQTSVKNLLANADKSRIIGVKFENKKIDELGVMYADLVVDVSGRGTKSFHWLGELGYETPDTTEVKVDVGYSTRIYERDANDPRGKKWIFNTPEAPKEYRGVGAFPIDNNRWIVSIAGWHGQSITATEEDFENTIKKLPIGDVYDIIKTCRPLSELMHYKYASSLRRHYEKLQRFPEGFIVLGDAACSFNPVYGQGMTSAALQLKTLDELLQKNTPGSTLWKQFFRRASKIIDTPWSMAVGEDFRFPETKGPRPAGVKLLNFYVSKVHRATLKDKIVCEAFLRVMSLLQPPSTLFHPKIVWRVLTA
jgi:2-polyprenyl-6-methoxyphenol hydroxylase-like FAD-dependent oxidoreductase